jgi:two-component system OmpR family sensor kinase
MKAFRSLRWRLQFWYALLLALVLIGFGLAAYAIERTDLVRSTDADLDRRVTGFARGQRNPPPPLGGPRRPQEGGPRADEGGDSPGNGFGPPDRPPGDRENGREGDISRQNRSNVRIPPQEQADYEADSGGKWYYVLWLHNGPDGIRSATAPAEVPRPSPFNLRRQGPVRRVRGNLHESFLPLGPGEFVLVGHDLTTDFEHLHSVAWLMALAAGLLLGSALVGGHWLIGRSLKPIAAIGAAANKIAAGDLRERIDPRDTESELGQLALVLDSTFSKLEASFAQQARFTADAAHELRTPLAVLLTHTQNALAVPCASEEHHEALAACQRAAQRMRALIESLLWLARLDSGGKPVKQVEFDLAVRVADCLELVRPLAARRGINVRVDLSPAPCVGDPEQIDQVITNLLTNAIQHNRENGEIRIATQTEGGSVGLTVADSGPGIAAEHLPHIFERFYRTDNSRSRASGGVGLGLAIARAIVEAHNGSLAVDSAVGRGATFSGTFPSPIVR